MRAKSSPSTPSFRLHKATGQGYVEINGRRIYLGRHDLPDTLVRYHQLIAEWASNGYRLSVDPAEVTVSELVLAYFSYVERYYVGSDGKSTGEVQATKHALRPLRLLYGREKVSTFGPRALKAVRQCMVDKGWCRNGVNSQIGRVKRCFKWGVENEMVPPSVLHGLQAVVGLKRGRCDAVESEPVKPVPQAHIDAVLSRVSRQVGAMIQLQLLTGARSGEIVRLRPIDFDTGGKIWTARLAQHKTAYRGRERILYFGPRAQQVVWEFMRDCPLNEFLFKPEEAEIERYAARHAGRKTPLKYGNVPGSNRVTDPKRKPGQQYSVESYRRAIARACDAAEVPRWSPHRLRHNAATLIRRDYGLEAAQVMLGHATADVTQIYAEADHEKALRVAELMG